MLKVAVGLSGGVDSAVSALLLKREGYEVVGVHLYCWPPKSEVEKSGLTREEWIKKNGCRADEDEQLALKTALELGIKFVKLDFSDEYNKRVVDYFYREYESGRTPNPDVLCNSEIKFGLFLDWAIKNGFDYVATGHYAKVDRNVTNTSRLQIPKDKHKDQTYFLWKLTEKELSRVLFPLGGYLKSEVREIAKEANLTVANRPDSQGICFIGNVDAREFLARRLTKKIGVVKNTAGEVIGEHDGVWFYTIGERGGWRMNPTKQKELVKNGVTPILYIVAKKAESNELVVAEAKEAVAGKFQISEENWLGEKPEESVRVRIRHTGELLAANIQSNEVTLLENVRGVAAGQSAVFYDPVGNVLGGAVIS